MTNTNGQLSYQCEKTLFFSFIPAPFLFLYVKYKSKAASTDLAAGNCLIQLFPLFLSLFLTAVFKC